MADLSINKKLNLIVSVERADKSVVHVHSVPISFQLYQAHYTFLHKVMSSMYSDDFSPATCSRIAFARMREIAAKEEDRFGKINETLLAEIWRLTNVSMPTPRGWEMIPFFDVMNGNGPLDPEDIWEVQNYICFFTAASWVHDKAEREGMYMLLTRYGAQITPLPFTDWHHSLQISKTEESIGEKGTPLYIPS